jgi:hypothetical protein
MEIEKHERDESPVKAASGLNDWLGPFTLLKVKAAESQHDEFGTLHRILVTFARKASVKFNTETLEVSSEEVRESCITFRCGEDIGGFAKGLRHLADHLDGMA